MNKKEFLSKLGEYLSYELPRQMVEKNLNYYSEYIDGEVRNGKAVSEVLEDLGDPQLIAHSIIDAATCGPDGIPNTSDDQNYRSEVYGNDQGSYSQTGSTGSGSGYSSQSGTGDRSQGSDDSGSRGFGNMFGGNNIHVYTGGCFTMILIILVVCALFAVVGTILGFLSPVLAPICIVLLILWLLERK